MKKILLSILALMLSAEMWANKITYTATEVLPIDGTTFDVAPSSHGWNEDTQMGTISFTPDVKQIFANAFKESKLISMTLPGTIKNDYGVCFLWLQKSDFHYF